MEISEHNKVLLKLFKKNLNKEGAFCVAALGLTPDGNEYSIHAVPDMTKGKLIGIFRDAADSLETGKMKVVKSY